jgi:hypothetical protein
MTPDKSLPRSKRQWQVAVDTVDACLAIDAARLYGLITGGPKIDVDRCVMILEFGKKKGIVPSKAKQIEVHNGKTGQKRDQLDG